LDSYLGAGYGHPVENPTTAGSRRDPEERAVLEFLEVLAADRIEGKQRSADEYAALFPRFAERIRREHGQLTELPSGGGGSPAEAGDHIGPYRLMQELGRGGQGVVYLAEDTRLRRRVALKVLEDSWRVLPGVTRMRLDREAAALARLDHPGICGLYEAGSATGSNGRNVAFLAMRFVEGETLARLLAEAARDGGALPSSREEMARRAELIELSARALHAAHSAGILHRDLKPANIMVTPAREPVILDFGLARDEDSSLPALTNPGDVVGTPAYMAPEQLDAKHGPIDARTDVWALGVTLWECLTLRRPFEGPTRDAVVRAILHDEPGDVRKVNSAVPRDLATIVAVALEKDPARRYRSAEDLAEDLRRFRASEPILAVPAGPATRLARWAARQPALATSLAATLLILAGGVTVTSILLAQTKRALGEVNRLADARLLAELLRHEEKLYPSVPATVAGPEGMDEWLRRAAALRARLPEHRRTLARLSERTASAPAGRLPDIDGAPDQWWKEQLAQLVAALERFQETIARVEKRRAFALTVEKATIEHVSDLWARAAEEIAKDPRFAGLVLKPQVGLIPIGADPVSGLQEFVHLESGSMPERDAQGKIQMTGDHGLVLVLVPGGTVRVGIDPPTPERPEGTPHVDPGYRKYEGPSHEVALDPYFLSKYEMTQGQWFRARGNNPADRKGERLGVYAQDPLRMPIEQVSWDDCTEELRRLGLLIPTEVQWERAYRAGTATVWWCGNEKLCLQGKENLGDKYALENGGADNWRYDPELNDGFTTSAPVGSLVPNPFGLYDMGGNLSEWVRDTWEDFTDHPARAGDGFRPGDFQYRLLRGSDFANTSANARSGRRGAVPPTARTQTLGIRPSRKLDL